MDGWDLSHRQVLHNRYRLEKLIQGVTEECASPGFWLKDTKDPDRVLMTETGIRRYNRRLQEKKDSPPWIRKWPKTTGNPLSPMGLQIQIRHFGAGLPYVPVSKKGMNLLLTALRRLR